MKRDSSRITLQDIAKVTGYTVNTVSRALKNKSDISRETCLRIQRVARDMGYVRNYLASSLRSGRTRTLAMIVGGFNNPFYAILADLIQSEAQRLGYGLMILSSRDDPEAEVRAVEMALSRQVDGVLITPCSFDSPSLVMLRSSGVPFVLLSRDQEGSLDDCVICDDELGGYLAGSHLLKQGCSRPAMISLHHVVFSSRRRLDGFRRACLEAGLPEEDILYAEPENDAALSSLLLSWRDAGVTGLFCFCDLEAWKTAALLESLSLRVPRDFSLVGFDNIQGYVDMGKSICTVDPSLREEACTAIELLRNRIHDPSLPPQRVTLPVSLVCRGSCMHRPVPPIVSEQ